MAASAANHNIEMIGDKASVSVAISAVMVVGLLASGASAHAAYKSSDPPDKGTVASPPSRVTAEFTEPPTEEESRMEVYDACGRRVDNGDPQTVGYEVTVTMSGSARGAYTVRWAVISRVDGHPTRGTFSFTSTGGEACPGESKPQGSSSGRDAEKQEQPREPQEEPAADSSGEETQAEGARGDRDDRRGARRTGRGGRGADAGEQGSRPEQMEPADDLAQEGPAREIAAEPAVWDMPAGDFAIALAISALIGAAGGFVYAGIMGPRRPTERE